MLSYEIRTDDKITTASSDRLIDPQEAREIHDWELVPQSGDPITVAVMDSGIDEEVAKTHPWFAEATLTKQYDATGQGTGEDAVGHGTGCASIIANAVSEVELYDVRIFGGSGANQGFGPIRDAYGWLIAHADEIDVVNMSWGSQRDVPQINNLHERLISKDVVDVVAAGNTGGDGGSPATAERAFSAGAIDEQGNPTRFSSFDPEKGNPDVAAVGQNVQMVRANGTAMGTPLSDDYVKSSGTSFAAPYVTAAYVNAMYKKRGDYDQKFMNAAQDVPGTPKDGGGILKLEDAIK